MQEAMQHAALDQPAGASTACAAFVMHAPRSRRAIAAIRQPPARQVPSDRAGRAAQKPVDGPLPLPLLCSAKITQRSSLLRCLLRLSIAKPYPLRAVGVALET